MFIVSPNGASASCNIGSGGYRSRLKAETTPVFVARPSIRRQRNLIVDQRVQRCLDVDFGVDDAGLLQG
jgi:hypothetical protein